MMQDAGQSASLTLHPKPCTLLFNHEGHEAEKKGTGFREQGKDKL
jgi:hypothetical protein